MTRQNLFSNVWDGDDEEAGTRHRVFWRPDDARMGATLYELAPGAQEDRMHMHYGAEEMFFVLSGRPLFRNQHGEEKLAPGDFVFCPEGRAGLHTFSNPTDEPVGILAISAGSFPDVVAYPEHGYAWVATRNPDSELLKRDGDPGIIARFEIPIEQLARPFAGRPRNAEEAARAASLHTYKSVVLSAASSSPSQPKHHAVRSSLGYLVVTPRSNSRGTTEFVAPRYKQSGANIAFWTLVRIHSEEHALLAWLGEEYRRYAATRRRLFPGIW